MGVSASIFLIAVGAILAFAVEATVEGLDIVTVGWILMALGVAGVLLSIASWDTWGGFGRSAVYRRETIERPTVVDTPVAQRRRTTYVERDDIVP